MLALIKENNEVKAKEMSYNEVKEMRKKEAEMTKVEFTTAEQLNDVLVEIDNDRVYASVEVLKDELIDRCENIIRIQQDSYNLVVRVTKKGIYKTYSDERLIVFTDEDAFLIGYDNELDEYGDYIIVTDVARVSDVQIIDENDNIVHI